MERNKSSAIAIIAVILGAMGLGAGGYSVFCVQTGAIEGDKGDDGDDGITTIKYITENEYPCSTEAEINNAIDAIGEGNGKITITGPITLTSPISIDGGGNYIIQGTGLSTIDCGGDNTAFAITNAKSCIIKDLIINASDVVDINKGIIYIDEFNDNPVYIQNIRIGGSEAGRGVYVISENVWVEHCFLHDLRRGIFLTYTAKNSHILDNTVYRMNHSSEASGIYVYQSNYNIISGNVIYDISSSDFTAIGIYFYDSEHNTISDNVVYDIISYDDNAYGIKLDLYCVLNTLTGNVVYTIDSSYDNAYGIHLTYSDSNSINANSISNLQPPGAGYGIFGDGDSDNNAVIGNTLQNCKAGIIISPVDNIVEHNVVVP